MKEVGSEFWNVPTVERGNTLFSPKTQWFLSGRSALQSIIFDLQDCHTVAMPSWCCDSMVDPFIKAGIEVHFYPVYWREWLHQDVLLDCDILFLMDYFGHTGPQPDLRGFKGVVIRDITHSLFSSTYFDADYYFGSLRKWCGVWTGGFAWTEDGHRLSLSDTNNGEYMALREKAMDWKNRYMNGCEMTDKGYLKVFGEAETILETVNAAPAADRDIRVAKKLDVELIRSRHQDNAKVLMNAFTDWLMFPVVKKTDFPMFVPVLIPNGKRDELRKHLINKAIYCPIHWPLSERHHLISARERFIYDNELSLVCDQRYTEQDMNRMVNAIHSFWKEM